MSNSTRPTQQQLDDLEALMQRMLALPVNQLDDEAGTTPALPSLPPLPEWESAPEEPPLLSLEKREEHADAEPEAVEEETDVVAVAERVLPALQPPEEEPQRYEVAEKATSDVLPMPAPVVPVRRAPIVVRPPDEVKEARRLRDQETRKERKVENGEPRQSAALAPELPAPVGPRRTRPLPERRMKMPTRNRPAAWMRLLLKCNRTFDRTVGRMGGPGRWLRGRYGRALLGLTGFLLLAAAAVLGAFDWIGWTW